MTSQLLDSNAQDTAVTLGYYTAEMHRSIFFCVYSLMRFLIHSSLLFFVATVLALLLVLCMGAALPASVDARATSTVSSVLGATGNEFEATRSRK